MQEKKVIFLISSSPFATLNNYEALRAAISFIDHTISIIWRGEGVNFTLKVVEKTMTKTFLRLAENLDLELYVSEEDLLEKSLDHMELENGIKRINRDDMINALKVADVVITF